MHTNRGGLADVEWTVQLVQLRHAHDRPSLHNTSTLESLDAIAADGLLPEDQVEKLRDAWLTAAKARNASSWCAANRSTNCRSVRRCGRSHSPRAGRPTIRGVPQRAPPGVTRRAKTVVTEVFRGLRVADAQRGRKMLWSAPR